MTDYEITEEDVQTLLRDNKVKDALLSSPEVLDSNSVDNIYKLKKLMIELEANKYTEGLISRDILLANLDKSDKNKNINFIRLASKFRKVNLPDPADFFYTQALIISGVSRAVKGYQQDKINENKEVKEARFSGLKKSGRFFKNN